MTKRYRTNEEAMEEFFRQRPHRIGGYLEVLFEEIDEEGGQGALLSSLRILSRVIGVGEVAKKAGMTRKGLQKALSETGNPNLQNVNAILHALGYRLAPKKLEKKPRRHA